MYIYIYMYHNLKCIKGELKEGRKGGRKEGRKNGIKGAAGSNGKKTGTDGWERKARRKERNGRPEVWNQRR
jgi:hypothetical protein